MSMRRNDVASTSFRRHVPTRFLINQCQTITFLILKSDIIANSRIELRGIVLHHLQIKLKLHLLLFYLSTWYICVFSCFTKKLKEKVGGILGGGEGGAKGMLAPLSNYWGGGGLSPCPPSSYAYVTVLLQS